MKLSLEGLKDRLSYSSSSGLFVWKTSLGGIEPGTVAGSFDRYGYRQITIDGIQYLAHRLAWFYMFGVWPNEVDHINGVRDDNRLVNLRDVNRTMNSRNHPRRRDNSSGRTGVYWFRGKWKARVNNKHLGTFNSFDEAASARQKAERSMGFTERVA